MIRDWNKRDPQAGAAATVALVGAAVLAAGAAGYSAYSQHKTAEKAEKAERDAGKAEADKIMERARRLKLEQQGGFAAAGVGLDSESVGTLLMETDRLAEQDALASLDTSRTRADIIGRQGDAAAVSGALDAASGLLGAYGNYQSASRPAQTAASIGGGRTTGGGVQKFGGSYSLLKG